MKDLAIFLQIFLKVYGKFINNSENKIPNRLFFLLFT